MYTSMQITELNIKRRIWVYLPGDYAISEKNYPVLYMQDGQNLFDVKSSFSGEWQIDEYLDSIDYAGIVVGIDNGGDIRINEYNPNDSEEHGIGLGRQYLLVVVNILKPYIDKHFRTLPGPGHTAIAGSSMGGLISFYAGLFHPKIFGAVGAISPSFWLAPELISQIDKMDVEGHKNQRYFFYGGRKEGENLVELLEAVSNRMKDKFGCKVTLDISEKGTHSESSWRKMFPTFYEWLMKKNIRN
ncbi:MAG: alpha/beta hydrolase [Bacteroidetes bacterium]|nr:alpha/beta hydrolase [Bacteroidota bacterium]